MTNDFFLNSKIILECESSPHVKMEPNWLSTFRDNYLDRRTDGRRADVEASPLP